MKENKQSTSVMLMHFIKEGVISPVFEHTACHH